MRRTTNKSVYERTTSYTSTLQMATFRQHIHLQTSGAYKAQHWRFGKKARRSTVASSQICSSVTAEASLSSLLHLCPPSQCWVHIWRGQKSWCGGTAPTHRLQTGGFIPACSWESFYGDLETFSAVPKLPVFQGKHSSCHGNPQQRAGGREETLLPPWQGAGTAGLRHASSELLLPPLHPRERFDGVFNY